MGLGVAAGRAALYVGSAEDGCELDMISWPPDVVQMSWRRRLADGSAADGPEYGRLETLSSLRSAHLSRSEEAHQKACPIILGGCSKPAENIAWKSRMRLDQSQEAIWVTVAVLSIGQVQDSLRKKKEERLEWRCGRRRLHEAPFSLLRTSGVACGRA